MSKSLKSMIIFGILSFIFLILNYVSPSLFPQLQTTILVLAVLVITIFSVSLIIFLVTAPYKYFTTHYTFLDKIVDDKKPWGLYLLALGLAIAFVVNAFSGILYLTTGINLSTSTTAGKILEFISGFSILFGLMLYTDHLRRKYRNKIPNNDGTDKA